MRFVILISSVASISATKGLSCTGSDQDWFQMNAAWKTDVSSCISNTESAVDCLVNSRVIYEVSSGCRSCIAGVVERDCSKKCIAGALTIDCEACLSSADFSTSCYGYVPPADCASDTTSSAWSDLVKSLVAGGNLNTEGAATRVGLSSSCFACVTKSLSIDPLMCLDSCTKNSASDVCLNCKVQTKTYILGICDPKYRYTQTSASCNGNDQTQTAWTSGLTLGLSKGLDIVGSWGDQQLQTDLKFTSRCYDCLYANMEIGCTYACNADGATREPCTTCSTNVDSRLKTICKSSPPVTPSVAPTCTGFQYSPFNDISSGMFFMILGMCIKSNKGYGYCVGPFVNDFPSTAQHPDECRTCVGTFFSAKRSSISDCITTNNGCALTIMNELFTACGIQDVTTTTTTTAPTTTTESTTSEDTTTTEPPTSSEDTTTETAEWSQCEDGSQFASISWEVGGVTYSADTLNNVWGSLVSCILTPENDQDLMNECVTDYMAEFTRVTNQACSDCFSMFLTAHSAHFPWCMYETCLADPTGEQCTTCVADVTSQFMTECNIADAQASSALHVAGITAALMLVAAFAVIPVV